MKESLKISVILLALLTLLLGIIYPTFMWGVGELFFHKRANGSLIYDKNGKIIGSEWIGQNFTSDSYFHPRPSAAGDKGYDASNSQGSNLGPTNQTYIDSVKGRIDDYRKSNNLSPNIPIPADAVTASGSGLDPHISLENAKLQIPRIAKARNLSPGAVEKLMEEFTEGWLHKRINVLRINLELDQLSH